jgi:hypothetical protein
LVELLVKKRVKNEPKTGLKSALIRAQKSEQKHAKNTPEKAPVNAL